MPRMTGILETGLDVDNLARSVDFYHRILGFEIIERSERLCAFSVAGRDVLILFQREEASGRGAGPRQWHPVEELE